MTIHTSAPQHSVTLVRMVDRQSGGSGFAPSFETIDLTPYLGLSGGISTTKMISQPCGAFSITFADRMHPQFQDSVYAAAEPMDLIEVRGSRQPVSWGQQLPLIMRGFVTDVRREESMGQDGTPQRVVRITGQDSGKLLDMFRVMFEFSAAGSGESYIELFRLQAITGMEVAVQSVSDFIGSLITRVVNPKIEQMMLFTNERIKPFQVEASVSDGLVLPQLAASIDSVSIWQLMETFADRPWNELFVLDHEDGPHLVFRPVPYRDYESGDMIMNGATDPGTLVIDQTDIVSMMVSRSDHRVANFFWVEPGVTQLDANALINASALRNGWPLDLTHDANHPNLYGPRKMSARTNLSPQSATTPIAMLPDSEKQQAADAHITWAQSRGRQLQLLNRDNALFEEGGLLVKGSEDWTIGKYLQVHRGSMVSDFYIEQVTHQISPLQGWTTQMQVCRGLGYRDRSREPNSPFIQEGRPGPYTGF